MTRWTYKDLVGLVRDVKERVSKDSRVTRPTLPVAAWHVVVERMDA